MTLSIPDADTRSPEVLPQPRLVDVPAAEAAAAAFMAALGIVANGDATRRTACRMAAAYAEFLSFEEFEATTFANREGHHDLVITRQIPFTSICAHHLLPFVGVANVGYVPGPRILGLSKLARAVEMFAARPQVQEDMTQQIATWLESTVTATGVGVLVAAEHVCMTRRGVKAHGASAVTTGWRGTLNEDRHMRAEFLALTHATDTRRAGR